MSDFYTLQKELTALSEKKVKYEKKMDSLIASRDYIVKKLKDDHNLTPEEITGKIGELEKEIEIATTKLEELVEKVKKYIEKMEWILEL